MFSQIMWGAGILVTFLILCLTWNVIEGRWEILTNGQKTILGAFLFLAAFVYLFNVMAFAGGLR